MVVNPRMNNLEFLALNIIRAMKHQPENSGGMRNLDLHRKHFVANRLARNNGTVDFSCSDPFHGCRTIGMHDSINSVTVILLMMHT